MSIMAKAGVKVAVSERALIQRINRKLAPDLEQLKKNRSPGNELGDYYVLDLNRNFVTAQNVDPEALGRELGVLAEWETVG